MTKYTKEEMPLQIAIMLATGELSKEDADYVFGRAKHIIAVAQKMKETAEKEPDKYPVDPEEAYRLGIVHDIGYGLTDIPTEYATRGGEWLRRVGYIHWEEVFYHGYYQTEYDSPLLRLLHYAEMTTSPNGEELTVSERIGEIMEQYGADSQQARDAIEMASMMGII